MLGWVLAVILLGYLVPHFLIGLLPTQDLKKKVRVVARRVDVCANVLSGATACSMVPRGRWSLGHLAVRLRPATAAKRECSF